MLNGKAEVPFIAIDMVGPGQVQVKTNCPPGHFFKMLKSAHDAMIEQFVQQEANPRGIVMPPPGLKIE